MVERKNFDYPPFTKLIKIIIRNTEYQKCVDTSNFLVQRLKFILNEVVSDSIEPPISRMHNKYIRYILIKVSNNSSISRVKSYIKNEVDTTKKIKLYNTSIIQIDVDPY